MKSQDPHCQRFAAAGQAGRRTGRGATAAAHQLRAPRSVVSKVDAQNYMGSRDCDNPPVKMERQRKEVASGLVGQRTRGSGRSSSMRGSAAGGALRFALGLCGISGTEGASQRLANLMFTRFSCRSTRVSAKSMSRFRRLNRGASRAGQTAITDANIWTAVEECQAESATFDCPASQATYGPIEDWDVGAVTRLNNWGSGCTDSNLNHCGCATPQFDSSDLFASDCASAIGSVLGVLGLQPGPLAVGCEQRHQHARRCGHLSALACEHTVFV